MPVFFQQQINESTRLGIWKIEETEEFFRDNVPLHRDVTHPHKRLQHLAGRFLLRFLYPDFPYELIQIADTRKPFLPDARFQFSISHCGDFAAAIVSMSTNVGIDVEIPVETIGRIRNKFLSSEERDHFGINGGEQDFALLTKLWSAKEAVFKWYGHGSVDFRQHIVLKKIDHARMQIACRFEKTGEDLNIEYREFPQIVLAWVVGSGLH